MASTAMRKFTNAKERVQQVILTEQPLARPARITLPISVVEMHPVHCLITTFHRDGMHSTKEAV